MIKQKQDEVRAQKAAKEGVSTHKMPAQEKVDDGATVEEIDDEEAKNIEMLQNMRKKQQEAKNKPKGEKKNEEVDEETGEKKEEENLKQKPNAGNGG